MTEEQLKGIAQKFFRVIDTHTEAMRDWMSKNKILPAGGPGLPLLLPQPPSLLPSPQLFLPPPPPPTPMGTNHRGLGGA